jgi:hypothetical protein
MDMYPSFKSGFRDISSQQRSKNMRREYHDMADNGKIDPQDVEKSH